MYNATTRTHQVMPTLTARKEWSKILTLLDKHRLNHYMSVEQYAQFLGSSYGWAHLLLNPYHRTRAGKSYPTYPLDLAYKMGQVLDLEIHSGDYTLVQTPVVIEAERKQQRMSYADLATLLGIKPMTLHRWLSRKTAMPVVECIRLLDYFQLPPLDIAGDLALHPTNPLRKPRGQGQWASTHKAHLGGFVEKDGMLVPKPVPKPKFEITADGQVRWND
jgi:hypothetical protein